MGKLINSKHPDDLYITSEHSKQLSNIQKNSIEWASRARGRGD